MDDLTGRPQKTRSATRDSTLSASHSVAAAARSAALSIAGSHRACTARWATWSGPGPCARTPATCSTGAGRCRRRHELPQQRPALDNGPETDGNACGSPATHGAAITTGSSKRDWSDSGGGWPSAGPVAGGGPVSTRPRSSNGSGPPGRVWGGSGRTRCSSTAQLGLRAVPRAPAHRPRTDAGPARPRPLRHLHRLSRRLPDPGAFPEPKSSTPDAASPT